MNATQIQALTALVVAIGSVLGTVLAIYHAVTAKRTAKQALGQQSSAAGPPSPGPSQR